MSFLRNVLINVNSTINQRRWLQQEAQRLAQTSDEESALLQRAFQALLNNDFSTEENESIQAVETLRRSLLVSNEKMDMLDFGAGTGTARRTEAEMSTGRANSSTVARAALSSKSAFWAKLLFKLIREFRPQTCLELGTNMGISAAYQASALKLNGSGKLITLEGAEARARLARKHFEHLGLNNVKVVTGRFQDTLPGLLKNSVVDYAFIDGHHDESATTQYFSEILAHAPGRALLAFDDISWSDGMKRAWAAVRQHPRVKTSVDLRVLGLCSL